MKLKFFGSEEEEEPIDIDSEEYVEVNVMDFEGRKGGRVGIRVEKLEEFSDTDHVLKAVREGSVVFVKITGLKEKDIGELKRAVEKLKKTVSANNGDIAGVEQDWLILTPEYATVER